MVGGFEIRNSRFRSGPSAQFRIPKSPDTQLTRQREAGGFRGVRCLEARLMVPPFHRDTEDHGRFKQLVPEGTDRKRRDHLGCCITEQIFAS